MLSKEYLALCEFSNLYQAFQKARKGKRRKESVAQFERNLEMELFQLEEELINFTYRPGAYRTFYRTEAKRRLISAAPFRDRVVHHALNNLTLPTLERHFIFDSYANRVGKGTHRALDRCTQFLRSSRYVMPFDIRQFFPSIDHEILISQFSHFFPQRDLLWLMKQILENGVGVLDEMYDMVWFPGDDLFAVHRRRGLPLGNLTSQVWANLYLNELDHFIKRDLKCKKYLRYVDDFLLFADQKATLWAWRTEIVSFLQGLRLTIHEAQAQPRPVEQGVTFLGFILFPDHRRLKPSSGYHYRRHLRQLITDYQNRCMDQEKIHHSIQGWVGHVSHGDTWGLRRAILREVCL